MKVIREISMKKMFVVGAGGHAKVIVDIIQENSEYEVVGLIDQKEGMGFWDIPILGNDQDLQRLRKEMNVNYAFVALGNGELREKVTKRVLDAGYKIINVISKNAVISSRATLGIGTVIMSGAVVNADVTIGDGCIINTNASVDHEGIIGDYTHIAPGCALSGKVTVGRQCLLGTGCRVIDGICIGDNSVVGAGTVVIKEINRNCTAVGVPAKIIKEKI